MFTKINIWRLLQFRKIVYVDADSIAIRAPDELFDLDVDFAAAPDIGWPDCFNSGVMVLKPNLGDFHSLLALAQRGISFDGADQGLLNTHFRNWQRISFTYNVTPSGNYQHLPAFRHFGSSMSMVHFIGPEKPWSRGRDKGGDVSGTYNELVGRWWSVYDHHYRTPAADYYAGQAPASAPAPSLTVQQYVKGETTGVSYRLSSVETQPKTREHMETKQPEMSEVPERPERPGRPERSERPRRPEKPVRQKKPEESGEAGKPVEPVESVRLEGVEEPPAVVKEPLHVEIGHLQPDRTQVLAAPVSTEQTHHQEGHPPEGLTFSPPKHDWDPARFPPPPQSKPEAVNFPFPVYTMSQDRDLFVAPPRGPPPKDLWYKIPEQAPADEPLKPLFPWETTAPVPTRIFPEDVPPPTDSELDVPALSTADDGTTTDEGPDIPTDLPADQITVSPTSPAFVPTTEPWETYTRSNAWDEIPDIDRYITSFQQARHGKVQVLIGDPAPDTDAAKRGRRRSNLITDFPSEIERPSLPVTPAPIRRPSFWSAERNEEGELPSAEGVPKQEDWVSHGGFWLLLLSISWAMLIVLLPDAVGPNSQARGSHKKDLGGATEDTRDTGRGRRGEKSRKNHTKSYPAWLVGKVATDEQETGLGGGGRVWY
ncbi:hypothetical protein GP486_007428 [Trichoglossum hirsutum]|uniref:glycogenin glucosyltransferase n=1 Tax=Trichoglossum hirsutum TaxID=265104 RepID=A0A9P8ICR8_9PEZI|nr:hypothetical protein GP486_007428 [Trichoglossum hirsutum]